MENSADKSKEQLLKEIDLLKTENVELKNNKDYYQIIAENAVDFIAITSFDLKAKYLYVSPSILQALGYEPEEMLGKSSLDFIHPEDKSFLLILIKKYINQKLKSVLRLDNPKITETVEFRFKNKAGDWSYLQNNFSFIGKNVLTVSRDITEQKQMNFEIKNSEARFKNIFSEAPIGIEIYNSEGNLIDANQRCLNIFGIDDVEELKGFNLFEDPNQSDERKTQVKAGKPFRYETEFDFELVKKYKLYKTSKSGKCFLNILITPYEITDLNENGYLVHIVDISDRKQAEEKLRDTEENLKNTFDISPGLICSANANTGYITECNPAVTNILGFSVSEFMAKPAVEFIHPDDRQSTVDEMTKQLSGGSVASFESRYQTKDGAYKWLAWQATVADQDGKVFAVATDITERKLLEKELQQSEEKYRIFFENNDAIILFVNPDNGEIIFSNEAAAKFYGYSREKLTGLNIANIHTLTPEEIKVKIADARKRNQNYFLFKHKLASGEIRDVEVYQSKLFLNDKDVFSIIVHDITDRKLAEVKLLESEQNFKAFTNQSSDGISVVDLNGNYTFVNPSFCKMVGWTAEELLQMTVFDVTADKYDTEIFKKTKTIKEGEPVFVKLVRKDRTEFIAEVIVKVFSIRGKKSVLGTIHDITERINSEKALNSALEKAEESDRLKTAFLANMSHEIRTPMNGILGFADLLKQPELSSDIRQKYIGIIEKSGVRMLNIINDLIDISKVEAGQIEVLISESNINEQIEYIYTFFKPEVERKGMQLFFNNSLTAKESVVKTDREKMFAILTNLVKNAIKYSDKGSIELGYEKKDNYLEFYVKDTGIGIPKERQQAIFNRFVQADSSDTRAFKGAGLGLTISKAYVEMLGGRIWVESESGVGSQFYFTIPYTSGVTEMESVTQVSDDNVGPEIQIKKLKILIAEDEELADLLLSLVLEKWGKEILHAKNGIEAVEVCRNNPDIDLVLMDIMMPEMYGYEATRKIREFNKDVVIIAQTAFCLAGDREKAIEAGCDDYISKPINKKLLLELIDKHIKIH